MVDVDYAERKEKAKGNKKEKGRDFTIEQPPLPDGHHWARIYCQNCCNEHSFQECTQKKRGNFQSPIGFRNGSENKGKRLARFYEADRIIRQKKKELEKRANSPDRYFSK